MTFDEHAKSCRQCSQPFGPCRVGIRLLVEGVDALTRQIPPLKTKGSA